MKIWLGNAMDRPPKLTEFTVDEASGERIDALLAARLDMSRSRIAQLIESGDVLLNGTPARKSQRPVPGDTIRVSVPPPEPSRIEAEPIPLNIVYEDGDLLVINKPAGMVVHPAPGHRSGTLVNALLHAVDDLSGIGGVSRPGIVHRLDKDTSGLLLVAKHDRAHRVLSDRLRSRKIRRRYLAAAWGHLSEDRVTVDAALGRHPTDRKRMAVVEDGKRAVTRFRVLEKWKAADLIGAQLETGRTHQIRVHLQHLGHPVVGDVTYGAGREKGFAGDTRSWAMEMARRTPRQFLHAFELKFRHPIDDRELVFRAELPDDLAQAADWAREASGYAG